MNLLIKRTLVLLRHAHTDMAGKFCGHYDPDLSRIGWDQLHELVQRMKAWPFTQVYSSSLLRARRTAEAIAASRHLDVSVRPGLNEIHFGAWEGKSWAEIEASYPDEASRWISAYPFGVIPDGEPFGGFRERVQSELLYFVQSGHECVVAVTHAGFIRTALAALGMPAAQSWNFPIEYGSVLELNYSQNTWQLQKAVSLVKEAMS